MQPQVISVTEFLNIINETLKFAYPQVVVEGEVSGYNLSRGKFVFFDLKDQESTLSCFMMVHQLKLPLEDGMKVRVTGYPKVFPRSSKFSMTVQSVESAGEGQLRRAMELLKKKLQEEGLFDPARKRTLPKFPARIGLITSATSAAYADFTKILNARWGGVELLLADVAVQGNQAPDQIVGALQYFNELRDPPDVLVLIRGGGSLEDLIAFSTEPVARAVAASRQPIIVGVGHEVDFSLADFAADVRAATPTDAARLVVPDRREITAHIEHLASRNESLLRAATSDRRSRIDRSLTRFEAYLRLPLERVHNLERGLEVFERIILTDRRHRLGTLVRVLASYNPQAVLNRGYAIVRHQGAILRDPAAVQPGDALELRVSQGEIQAEVSKN